MQVWKEQRQCIWLVWRPQGCAGVAASILATVHQMSGGHACVIKEQELLLVFVFVTVFATVLHWTLG